MPSATVFLQFLVAETRVVMALLAGMILLAGKLGISLGGCASSRLAASSAVCPTLSLRLSFDGELRGQQMQKRVEPTRISAIGISMGDAETPFAARQFVKRWSRCRLFCLAARYLQLPSPAYKLDTNTDSHRKFIIG
jgi:hypothetical protein